MANRKLKVVYVLTSGGLGGAQRYVADLSASLPKDEFETSVIFGGKEIPSLSNRIVPFFFNDLMATWGLARTFKRLSPDIIHLNSSKAGVLGSFGAFLYNSLFRLKDTPKAKVVFTAHGWVMNPGNHPPRFVREAYALIHRGAAYFQDAIINVSEADAEIAKRFRVAPQSKLFTIPNGIPPQGSYYDQPSARKKIVEKLPSKLDANGVWIGSIGRLAKEKDYGTLVQAIASIPSATCIVIGSGGREKKLASMTRALKIENRFFIAPPGDEDARLMRAFDIFVLPSIKEGLPYSLLEAGRAGVPSIVTDTGGMPEVLRAFPKSIVPKRNPDALAHRLRAFIENPALRNEAKTLLEKAVRERYRLDQMSAATEKIYRDLTEN